MPTGQDELVFLPLGGVGEIGMNLGIYGYGPPVARRWLAVDVGVGFAGADLPGVDLVFPDIGFLERNRAGLDGIVITHAHEDHFGALADLWPRLGAPVYASPFTAGLLMAKLASEPGKKPVPIDIVRAGDRRTIGPFDVEFINVAHSIPEPMALAIRTPLGTIVHTGDWKLDPTPGLGAPTDLDRLQAIGDAGVLALVCDSTNAMREGESASEADVARELVTIMREAPARIAFTLFASNVGRIRSIAEAAADAQRQVVVVGRALRRAIEVADELGMLEGLPPFYDTDVLQHLPPEAVVLLLSGSQGEPRAALARVAQGDDRSVSLGRGDTVIFSSRAIPGNERAISDIINRLAAAGVSVITDRDRLVHVSGHPRRGELRQMYARVRPQIAVPVHGEPMHLAAHAALARELGIGAVVSAHDGAVVRLAPGAASIVSEVPVGRLYRDGTIIGTLDEVGVADRRRMAFSGHIAVALVISPRGDLLATPEFGLEGLPDRDSSGRFFVDIVETAIRGALDSIPKPRRRDPDLIEDAVRRSVRAAVREAWDKKPVCTVLVTVLSAPP